MFRFFEKRINPFPEVDPSTPPNTLFAFCMYYTKGIWFYFILMAILTAGIALCETTLFGFLGQLVDWLGTKNPKTFLKDEAVQLIKMATLLVVIFPIIVIFHSLIMNQVIMGNYPMLIRWLSHRFMLKQSISYFNDELAGRIATKVLQTALAIREIIMKVLDVMVYVIIYFTSMIFILSKADIRLLIPLFFWLLGYIFILLYFVPKMSKISKEQADARSSMAGKIIDSYNNIATLKIFSYNSRESSYIKEGMNDFLKTVYPQMRLGSWNSINLWLLNIYLIFSLTTLSIYLWINSAITPGAIAIAMGLSLRLNGMSQWIVWEVSMLFENIGTVKDGINTISKEPTIVDKINAQPLIVSKGELEFKNITFYYDNNLLFSNFNLHIKSGEKIGIVGKSGAGKSTLVHLLLRFFDVNEGEILIDGQNIYDVTQESLRSNIGMVTQDSSLLHRSVKDNILFSKPNATNEDLIEACKNAEALDFIANLKDNKGRTGFDAHVGERGVKLSGGQRQRIAIARTMLKNAPILILDEATSALDSEVENDIQKSFEKITKSKTVIAIAHRLSTIAAMDRLIVMDSGKIVEMGSHQELLSKKGLYSNLWEKQYKGFLGDN